MAGFVGRKIGPYDVLLQIAEGGMATVYRGYDPERDRNVAIKILSPFLSNQPKFRARFEREAELMHSLRHPNIVPVLDYGRARHSLYLVMPYMNVGSLEDRLRQGTISVAAGSRILDQMAVALEHAHAFGVVHRDVKPANILMDEKFNAWLADFGFAYVFDASINLTGSTLIGTPAYMAPEQILGHKVTPKADQYALGVVLYQLCTGRVPYDAATPMKLALKHATEPLPRPRLANPNLPDAVEEVLLRALSKDPNFRYDSVREFNLAFHESLKKVIDPETGGLRPGVLSHLPKAELAPFSATLAGASVQMLERTPRPRLIPRINPKLFPWLLGVAPVALVAAVFGVRAMLGSVDSPMAEQVPIQQVLVDGEVDGEGESGSGDLLETAVMATVMSLQETEEIIIPPGSPTAPEIAGVLATPTPMTLLPTQTPTELTPTSIPATVSPPTPADQPSLCASYGLDEFMLNRDQVSWQLLTGEAEATVLQALTISWPSENGNLFKVDLGGSTIWVGDVGSPADIQTWTGGETSRIVNDSESIAFRFNDDAQAQGYAVELSLENGCQVHTSD
jgi:serine/threonine protein kinase